MTVQFSCPKCGTRFRVRAELAGTSGRCNKCLHRFTVPAPQLAMDTVAVSGRFRLADANGVNPLPVKGTEIDPEVAVKSEAGILQHVGTNDNSQRVQRNTKTLGTLPASETKLKPIEQVIVGENFDNDGLDEEYQLAPLEETRRPVNESLNKQVLRQADAAKKLYGNRVGTALGFLSAASQFAFLANWFFVMMALLGAVTGNAGWLMIGATVIVLICMLQLALNFVYLVLLPLDGSPTRALRFFLPPYEEQQRRQVGSALLGLITPIIPVVGIALLFTFAPGLSRAKTAEHATIKQRLGAEVDALKQEMRGKIDRGIKKTKRAVQDVDVGDIQNRAQQQINQLRESGQQVIDGQGR